jgi:transcriptional regulator with GAF, ATPase, and Fis domain
VSIANARAFEELDALRVRLELENDYLRSEVKENFGGLLGQSAAMHKILEQIALVAPTDASVLILGESGTGKELIARAIHRQGPRRDKPFVPVNPAALSESLVESELFGYEKGAFTGAYQRKLGRFELAQGGTLFLDEIGSIKSDLQAKLLRVLQEREFERVGGGRTVRLDARVIVATNADLKQAMADGRFREDLFYRLNVVPITVPPLRDRRGDIPLLVRHFVRRYNQQLTRRVAGLTPEALAVLTEYPWPGNVRELQNVIERLVGLVEGSTIGLSDLPLDLLLPDQRPGQRPPGYSLNEATEEFERQIALRVLERARWNVSEAARILGVQRSSLNMKLARWGVRRPEATG